MLIIMAGILHDPVFQAIRQKEAHMLKMTQNSSPLCSFLDIVTSRQAILVAFTQ